MSEKLVIYKYNTEVMLYVVTYIVLEKQFPCGGRTYFIKKEEGGSTEALYVLIQQLCYWSREFSVEFIKW